MFARSNVLTCFDDVTSMDRETTNLEDDRETFLSFSQYRQWSRDSSVGMATGYGLDDRGVGVRVLRSIIFCSVYRPYRL
jgi:hypothetical protein